ncbi:MAG: ATP-dependent DNA helicase, partial [Verrucomicrobia bacterium]
PGQENTLSDLRAAARRSPVVLLEAPTGFGKTGIALEYALGELAAGRLTRLIYLTGKSTGQLQVVRQLEAMLGSPPAATWWQIRNKADHCINDIYHCFRDACPILDGQAERWPDSGLQRFCQDPAIPRDLDTLRDAGRAARVCPYEITRAALPFTDIWIADYNYIFAPANRGFLLDLPGFEPAHTLLIIDEAHNLPARVADAHSADLSLREVRDAVAALDFAGAPHALTAAWERLAHFLARLQPTDTLDPDEDAALHELLATIDRHSAEAALDYAALGPAVCDTLFKVASLHATLSSGQRTLPELIWAPAPGIARFSCLDAAAAIAETIGTFGHALFLSATLAPIDVFERQCGLDLLGIDTARIQATTPWRDEAYDVAIDTRVDTRYDHRRRHLARTAASIADMRRHADGPVVAFFPAYRYAEDILAHLQAGHPDIRAAFQTRTRDLTERTAFIEESLALADVLLLVLGSSFAEGIDLLGGRIAGVVVVGPALPEVNAVQRARLDASRAPTRTAAFREVYQIPGMQKVNQALGRLVRAPGQRARVLLHCRRFAQPDYLQLLAPEYREAAVLQTDDDLQRWLRGSPL